jgi:hypothetical protein
MEIELSKDELRWILRICKNYYCKNYYSNNESTMQIIHGENAQAFSDLINKLTIKYSMGEK